jgi:hypothetical protein
MPLVFTRNFGSSVARNLFILSLAFIFIPDTLYAYPVFGTKRYGRSTGLPRRVSTWGVPAPLPLQAYQQPQPRAQNSYGLGVSSGPAYYTADSLGNYPYTQDYPDNDYYYAQDPGTFGSYPYYPASSVTNGNMKYSLYQSVAPYYYGDGRQRMGYGYYGYDEASDPVYDLQEELQQEEDREEREESLPVGQETWFDGSSDSQRQPQRDNLADVNAAFLQNLIMSHMYNDANSGHIVRHPPHEGGAYPAGDDGVQGIWAYETGRSRSQVSGEYQNSDEDLEDEDVRELKSLVKKNRSGELNDYAGVTPSNWFPALSTTQNDHAQTWYAHSSVVDNRHGPEYYEPIWFPTENGPWFENGWGTGMSYKRSPQPLYKSIRSYNKKQESSEYGPWIPKGNINFSDRKGNGMKTPVSSSKVAKTHHEQHATGPKNIKNTPTETIPTHSLTTTPVPTTLSPAETTSISSAEIDSRRGQKEVALLRPPAPLRHQFTPQTSGKMLTRSRTAPPHPSSVYDTIKQLLSMERGLRKVSSSQMWDTGAKQSLACPQ